MLSALVSGSIICSRISTLKVDINVQKTQHLEAMAKTSARHWNLHAMDAARKGIGYQSVLDQAKNLIQDQLELVGSPSKTLLL